MNYFDFITKYQIPAVPIQKRDATSIEVREPIKPVKRTFSSPYIEQQYNAYLEKRPWDLVSAENLIANLEKQQSEGISQGKEKSEEEKKAAESRVERQGEIEKEQKDREKAAEVVSEGLNYLSPTYWVNQVVDPEYQITSDAGQLVGDILLDPTTYLTAGIVPAAKSAAKQGVKKSVAKAVRGSLQDKVAKTTSVDIATASKTGLPNFITVSDYAKTLPADNNFRAHVSRITDGLTEWQKKYPDLVSLDNIHIINVDENQGNDVLKYLQTYKLYGNAPDAVYSGVANRLVNNAKQGTASGIYLTGSGRGLILYSPSSMNSNNLTDLSGMLSHELDHAIKGPVLSNMKPEDYIVTGYYPDYFTHNNGFEVAARGSQLKDYAGFTDSKQRFTPSTLQQTYAKYLSDNTQMDNNMTDLFNRINDWDNFTNFVNDHATVMATPIVGINLLNKSNNGEKQQHLY